MKIIHLEGDNFKELIQEKVLVDFYADWCGPCKMLAPELEKVTGDISIVKVNVDEFEDLAREYGVMSIPTFIMFKDGKEVAKNVGSMPKSGIEAFINSNI